MTTTPGENPGSSPFHRPTAAIGIAAAAYLVTVVVTWPGLRVPVAVPGFPGWLNILGEAIVTLAPLVVGAMLAAWVGGRTADGGMSRVLGIRFRPVDLLAGALVALVARAVVEVATPTVGSLRPALDDGSPETNAALAASIVVLVLAAPFAEEVFFRGAVQRSLHTLLVGPLTPRVAAVLAVAVTTLAFVLLHAVPYGAEVPLSVLLAPLLVGIGAGTLAVVTGRIGAGIVAHVLFNLSGVLLLLG